MCMLERDLSRRGQRQEACSRSEELAAVNLGHNLARVQLHGKGIEGPPCWGCMDGLVEILREVRIPPAGHRALADVVTVDQTLGKNCGG